MHLKNYHAGTLKEALDQVRQDLGPDAIILSTFEDAAGAHVTAALEPEVPTPPPPSALTPLEIMNQVCRWLEIHPLPTPISDQLIQKCAALTQEHLYSTWDDFLNSWCSLAPDFLKKASHPVWVVLGPPGAGKTVTLAKMASEFMAAKKPVALITLDTLKSGAVNQLRVYAEALKCPVRHADSEEKLLGHTLELKHHTLLIDTPGMNPYDPKDHVFLNKLINLIPAQRVLVLPTGLDPYELMTSLKVYQLLKPDYLIQTRLDTAQRLGSLLTLLSQGTLKLGYLGVGPALGTRLVPATASFLHQTLQGHFIKETAA